VAKVFVDVPVPPGDVAADRAGVFQVAAVVGAVEVEWRSAVN
jgi:hypothetical protein